MMRRIFLAVALATSAMSVAPLSSADVGLSINVGEPGFYGRIDIGDSPQPELIYRRPIYFDDDALDRPPVYLHVPPGYARHWRAHCREFHACGERVYFVRDEWYEHEYAPRYRERHLRRHDRDRHDRDRYDRGHDDHGRFEHGHHTGHGHG